MIVISDEEESVVSDGGKQQPNPEKSVGNNLSNYISGNYGGASFILHSIIINPFAGPDGVQCLNDQLNQGRNGKTSDYGQIYADISQQTGGVIGSVCADDYASQLEDIGGSVANSDKTYQLECVVVTGGDYPTSVTSGGNPISVPYTFAGNKIEFAQELSVGDYRVDYYCFK